MRLRGSFCRKLPLLRALQTRRIPTGLSRDTFDFRYLGKSQVSCHAATFSCSTSPLPPPPGRTKAKGLSAEPGTAHLQRLQLELTLGEGKEKKRPARPWRPRSRPAFRSHFGEARWNCFSSRSYPSPQIYFKMELAEASEMMDETKT